jgi:3-hydroxy-9,10-secoandrosta-1,3,5(10)-triene-9,17-dione monooxygenase reductase component
MVSGVVVVTTWDGETPWGTTVNSFSSVSLRPPLVLVAFDRDRHIVPALIRTGRYAANILGEGQAALSDCFAGAPSQHPRSQLCGAPWHVGETGLPLLSGALATLECTTVDIHATGDHDLYIARVDRAAAADEGLPLLYHSGRYLRVERAQLRDLEGKPED